MSCTLGVKRMPDELVDNLTSNLMPLSDDKNLIKNLRLQEAGKGQLVSL
jgi:hypothetical protein